MEENKKPIRYRTSFVVLIILILAISSSLLSVKIDNGSIANKLSVSYQDLVYKDIRDIINSARFYDGYFYKEKNEYIDFVSYGRYFQWENEYDEEYIDSQFTNIRNFNDNEEIDRSIEKYIENNDEYWIHLSANYEDINLESNIDNQDERYINDLRDIENDIVLKASYLEEGEKINLYLSFDPGDEIILKGIEYSNYTYKLLINIVIFALISALILLILTTFTNYKIAKEYSTFSFITSIPIELYAILFIFVIILPIPLFIDFYNVQGTFDFLDILSFVKENIIYLYLLLLLWFGLFDTYIIYFTLMFKSFYHDGFKSFIFQKSIIITLLRAIFRGLRKLFKKIFGNINITDKPLWIGIFILGIAFSILMGSFFSSYGVTMVFALIFLLIFKKIMNILKDFKEIEDMSEELSKGNYNIYIDEDNNSFKVLAKNMNSTIDSLGQAVSRELKSERMKTELITNVSHDLKTPLTSIINYSELIIVEDDVNNIKDYAKVINEKSHKLKELIDSLFDFSKITTSNISFDKMEIDFIELINMSIGEWTDKFNEKNLEVLTNYPEEQILLNLDGQYSSRILDNIFSNIYKYAMENTRVYIDVYDEGNKVRLDIKNISKYPLNISANELLERFTRGDASRSTEGSGLGLSIAQSLTEQQNGKFDIEILGDLFKVEIIFNK